MCRAAARSRCSRCCSCIAARPSISTASWTSCGTAPGRRTRATPCMSSRRGCGPRSATSSCVSEGGGYAVRLPPGGLDADRFEERFRLGREELARGEPWEAAATLREALALWRGPALADVADEHFAQPEIARLEDLRLTCVSERIEADLACGRHAEVIGELEGAGPRAPAARAAARPADARPLPRGPPGRRTRRLPRRAPGARRRARHRAVARPARARGGDPAPGGPGARAAAEARRRARARWAPLGDLRRLAARRPGRAGLDPESLRPWSSASTPPAAGLHAATAGASSSCTATRSSRCWACRWRTTMTRSGRCGPRRSCATSSRSACAPAPAPARWSPPATRR